MCVRSRECPWRAGRQPVATRRSPSLRSRSRRLRPAAAGTHGATTSDPPARDTRGSEQETFSRRTGNFGALSRGWGGSAVDGLGEGGAAAPRRRYCAGTEHHTAFVSRRRRHCTEQTQKRHLRDSNSRPLDDCTGAENDLAAHEISVTQVEAGVCGKALQVRRLVGKEPRLLLLQ